LEVESGGFGAGTVIRFSMTVLGISQQFHMIVSEPEPGRILKESDPHSGQWSSFTIDPVNGGYQSQVTIDTEAFASPGFKGLIERLMNPPLTRRIFTQELRQLNQYVQTRAAVQQHS
jgi:hypothetical protein